MKTANKIIILACLVLIVSCANDKSEICDKEVGKIYLLDIYGEKEKYYEEEKDTFIVEKRLFVSDSCFGVYNEKNTITAYQYADKQNNAGVYISYIIKSKNPKTGLFQTLFEIEQPEEQLFDIELCQGYTYKRRNVNGNNRSAIDKKFIRVVQTLKTGVLDFECLNFEIDYNLNWTLISKEKLNTSYEITNYGYCIDTVNKVLNLDRPQSNVIRFNEAFFHTSIDWKCQ